MAKDKKVQTTKVKKKKWVAVKAPKFLNEALIGEVPVYEEAQLINKVMPANMMTLTGDVKKQAVTMKFLITEAKAGSAQTSPLKIEMNQSMIKRHVRRGKDRLDESLVFVTKDDVKVRIKPMIITGSKTKSSLQKALRHKLVKETHTYVTSKNYEEIFSDILGNKIQKELKEKLAKICPIKLVEIRMYEKERIKAKISKLPTKEEKKKEAKDKDFEDEQNEDMELKISKNKVTSTTEEEIDDLDAESEN